MGFKAALGEEAEGGEKRRAIGQIAQVGRQVIGWSRLAASVTVRSACLGAGGAATSTSSSCIQQGEGAALAT
jgi:hypothetical protein